MFPYKTSFKHVKLSALYWSIRAVYMLVIQILAVWFTPALDHWKSCAHRIGPDII